LELHNWTPGDHYYLGIFLVGAYQEVMGSHHNLFGHPNEAQIAIDSYGRFHVTKIVQGSRIEDMMQFARYEKQQLWDAYQKQLSVQVESGKLTQEQAGMLLQEYQAFAKESTYLD
jgi:arginine decarboxylase